VADRPLLAAARVRLDRLLVGPLLRGVRPGGLPVDQRPFVTRLVRLAEAAADEAVVLDLPAVALVLRPERLRPRRPSVFAEITHSSGSISAWPSRRPGSTSRAARGRAAPRSRPPGRRSRPSASTRSRPG